MQAFCLVRNVDDVAEDWAIGTIRRRPPDGERGVSGCGHSDVGVINGRGSCMTEWIDRWIVRQRRERTRRRQKNKQLPEE